MTESTIYLAVKGDSWVAYHQGEIARKVIDLFGTHAIITGYPHTADPDHVLTEIRRLNPDCNVYLNPTH